MCGVGEITKQGVAAFGPQGTVLGPLLVSIGVATFTFLRKAVHDAQTNAERLMAVGSPLGAVDATHVASSRDGIDEAAQRGGSAAAGFGRFGSSPAPLAPPTPAGAGQRMVGGSYDSGNSTTTAGGRGGEEEEEEEED